MRIIAYIRVSTDDQRENGHSLAHQAERLRVWAHLQGHELSATIVDEGVSGSVPILSRCGGARMLQMLRDGFADGVVVTRINRLFRNLLDGVRFFEEDLANLGANVFSLSESISTDTPAGWLALVMQLAVADYDRRQDVQAGIETSAALKKSGKVYGGVPYGCVSVGGENYFDEAKGRGRKRGAVLLRDPNTWATRCYIVELLRGGMSKVDVIGRLVKERINAPQGGKHWHACTLRSLVRTHDELTRLLFANDHSYGEASRSPDDRNSPSLRAGDGKSRRLFDRSHAVAPDPELHRAATPAGAEETKVSHVH